MANSSGLLKRTLKRVRRAWPLGDPDKSVWEGTLSPQLSDDDTELLRKRIDACLLAKGGEVSSRARAAELGKTYLQLDDTGRQRFLHVLAVEYDVVAETIDEAIELHRAAEDPATRGKAQKQLTQALVAPRVRLLRQFNGLNEGVKFLVDLRADLKRFVRDDEALVSLDEDLHQLLASWFDIGFLELSRITWDTKASLLEKLIVYEAVHAITSWEDLKNRLEEDRRCYAFFHPNMPNEPLIFVQVALVNGMSGNIQNLLDQKAPVGDADSADCAIFYSISNCQNGLAGVSFGNFLIKRVVDALVRDLPNLKTYATLSPIPGFKAWLDARLAVGRIGGTTPLLTGPETEQLGTLFDDSTLDHAQALAKLFEDEHWWQDEARAAVLEPILMRLCALYLLREKSGRRTLDRVAHFHLSNGARVERINWLADTSPNGMRQSLGMMVNYQYRVADIEKNHEAYSGQSRMSAASAVNKLLKLSGKH